QIDASNGSRFQVAEHMPASASHTAPDIRDVAAGNRNAFKGTAIQRDERIEGLVFRSEVQSRDFAGIAEVDENRRLREQSMDAGVEQFGPQLGARSGRGTGPGKRIFDTLVYSPTSGRIHGTAPRASISKKGRRVVPIQAPVLHYFPEERAEL